MAGGQQNCKVESCAASSKEGDEDSTDTTNIEQPLEMVENATLDLDQVAAQYRGLARLQHLEFIARCCPALRKEALKLAEKFVLQTRNTALAATIHDMMLKALAEGEPERAPGAQEALKTSLNKEWIERTRSEAKLELEALINHRQELLSHKGTNLTTDIRRATVELANLYLDCGDLQNAVKSWHSASYYCVTFASQVLVLLSAIKVYVHMKAWDNVQSCVENAQKMVDTVKETECSTDEKKQVQSELHCASGLVQLAATSFRAAAFTFLKISFDFCNFPQMLSLSGVTVYTVLCALTTFERKELQNHLFSRNFMKFLELEPEWRELVQLFTQGTYSPVLRRLQQLKNTLLLDLHLHTHIHTFLFLVRKRALCQYMDPYLSVSMSKIALEFSTPVEALEEEFVDLIMRDQISARIDSQNKVLYFKKVDLRSTTFAQTLATGKAYLRKSAALLLRAAVLKNGVNVTAQVNLPNPHKEPPHPLSKFLHDYSHDDDDDN